jgi:hypothetical protein
MNNHFGNGGGVFYGMSIITSGVGGIFAAFFFVVHVMVHSLILGSSRGWKGNQGSMNLCMVPWEVLREQGRPTTTAVNCKVCLSDR